MKYFVLFLIIPFFGGLLWEKLPARLRGWIVPLVCLAMVIVYYVLSKL